MSETALTIGWPQAFDERRTIRLSQRGSREAYGVLVKSYMRRAYVAALALTGNREDALDASQEAFVKAWRAIRRFDLARPFYPWFYRILRNLCFDLIRRRRIRPRDGIEADVRDPAEGPDVAARRSERRDLVHAALRRLPDRDREILVLRHFQHLSYREIAESLEIPLGTVMSRLFAARQRMRSQLAERLPAEV
jgi:RNA polymerase sigma-70 factor (ECF subfamily)